MTFYFLLNILPKCRKICCAIAAVIAIFGCKGKHGIFPSPEGYNINKPLVTKLPSALDEISGIIYYSKDKSLFAIQDENGWLYKIHSGKGGEIEKWKFSTGADYEDVALVDSTFFAIKSNGTIEAFRFFRPDSSVLHVFHSPLKGKNEFETLYLDSSRQQLLFICKDCEADKKITSVYGFDYKQMKFVDSPVFQIDEKDIQKKFGDKITKFKPSAANINPRTGELFILSSVNKLLVVADRNGKIKDAFELDPHLFKQPEGLTFSTQGDLLISNESAKVGAATVLLFKYNESPRK